MAEPTKPETTLNKQRGDAEMLLRFGAAIGVPRSPVASDAEYRDIDPATGTPYLVAPDGYKVHDLEHLLPSPVRKRAKVAVSDSAGFIHYTEKHGGEHNCVIYADIDSEANNLKLVAVINDHDEDTPGWRDHTCTLEPKLSVEWRRWIGKNRIAMSQADFATWIEDNLQDIASVEGMPTGADMLAMALGFEKTAEKRLKSRINLQSGGTRFEYVDDEDKDTRTSMQVFERFTIGIPVFDGSASGYPVEARLKYREKDGRVNFWFELIRPDRVFKSAVAEELDRIQEATGFLMINGVAGI